MKILADSQIPFVQEYFGVYGELILKPGRAIVAADVKDADMLLVRSVTPVNETLLAHSKVKFIGSVTAGADHLDTAWLNTAGIKWATAHGFNAAPVADYVVCVIAALQHRGLLRQTKKTAAVIGVGNVGKLVKEHLERLQFEVIVCDPLRAEKEPDFSSTPIEQIADVDLISLHVPLTRHGSYPTYHFIDAAFLQRQAINSILLNASRGAVINSADLLQHGTHLNWCFDVWPHEPAIDAALLEQALLASPHIAGYSAQGKMRGIEMIYQAACQAQVITPQQRAPVEIPLHVLKIANEPHAWQEIVLGVFNPLVMTAIMRATLLPNSAEQAVMFDELRHRFHDRNEFKFTKVAAEVVKESDRALLKSLGMIL